MVKKILRKECCLECWWVITYGLLKIQFTKVKLQRLLNCHPFPFVCEPLTGKVCFPHFAFLDPCNVADP